MDRLHSKSLAVRLKQASIQGLFSSRNTFSTPRKAASTTSSPIKRQITDKQLTKSTERHAKLEEDKEDASDGEREAVATMQNLHLRFKHDSGVSLTFTKPISIDIPPQGRAVTRSYSTVHSRVPRQVAVTVSRVRKRSDEKEKWLVRSHSDRLIPTLKPRPFLERVSTHIHPDINTIEPVKVGRYGGVLRGWKVQGRPALGIMSRHTPERKKSQWLMPKAVSE